MYKPREDSFMLEGQVKKYAKGIVLDMGVGSGIQALEAAKSKKVTKVYAVDTDYCSIEYCKEKIDNKKIIFLKSDLFRVFRLDRRYKRLKFDTIIFNPPYLPEDLKIKDLALDGGKKGYELICRFLNESLDYIKPKTKILLVFSSLTGKETLEKFLAKKRFYFTKLDKKHIFFEDLYVYLLEKE